VFKHKKDLNLNDEKPLPVFVIRVLTKEIIEVVLNVYLKLKENKKRVLFSIKAINFRMKCNQFDQEVDYKVQFFPKNSFTCIRLIVKVFKHKERKQ
jgi:hypothetical protein